MGAIHAHHQMLMGAGASSGDPFLAQTLLHIACTGTAGSTTFTDLTGRHTITPSGNAQVVTDSDFPGGCLGLDGTGDFLTASGNLPDYLSVGGTDRTWECYGKFSAFSKSLNALFGRYNGASPEAFSFFVTASGGTATGLQVRQGDGVVVNRTGTINANTLYHFAFVRRASDGLARLYINGIQIGADITTMTGTLGNNGQAIDIGSAGPSFPSDFTTACKLGEVRATAGARYWANFTPPAMPLPSS